MKSSILKTLATAGLLLGTSAAVALAGPLMERAKAGKAIRIGFANEKPFAYPGDNGAPKGFVNAYVLAVLKNMGYTKIEPVETDWGGLIPGLNAGRFDIITGGMNILKKRCENVDFSQPMGRVGDAFIVAKGNPKHIENYTDIKKAGAIMATGAGYSNIAQAKEAGVPASDIMTVPGPTEILAAVKSGRADAGAMTFFAAEQLAQSAPDKVQVTDPGKMPESSMNWIGIGFKKADADFVKAFDAAQKKYLGTPAMLKSVAQYGYTKASLPGGKTTAWVCAHR
ncbi:transporter substrate-binding domain-containing protein [Solirhodobacter olei]|uniref:transporter substrate-binding domain-containing protein n=1 Tax=Solirhodobacter olei TaxID=2493082 RepID=UPI000FDBDC9D|nr:transporter substrate-binding domain-containing protein [Solirhodobacter olei]